MVSPIQTLSKKYNENTIYIKRDDLLPFSMGGNKVRIADEFFADMLSSGCNCMIAYGNARSNLCRVLSNLCFAHNIPCVVISPSDDNGDRISTGNSIMCDVCKAHYVFCDKKNVADTVKRVLDECRKKGFRPYYIYGDQYGNGNKVVPVRAYEKVYYEIKKQLEDMNVSVDYIFLATGTGMTQSGLLLGAEKCSGTEKIVGISVAREENAVKSKLKEYLAASGLDPVRDQRIFVYKGRNYQGYGQYGYPIMKVIKETLQNEGFALDPTYTGKAFYGMQSYIKEHDIKNSNILFIHTGGAPLYYDFLKQTELQAKIFIKKLEDSELNREKLSKYLEKCSGEFAVPLAERIDFNAYAAKVLNLGYVFAVVDSADHLEGAVCGYANDHQGLAAFETILVAERHLRGTGLTQILFETQLKYCKEQGMKKIKFSTNIGNIGAQNFYKKNNIPVIDVENDDQQIHYELAL